MIRPTLIAMALVLSLAALAQDGAPTPAVDLRAARALEQLKESNPEHFEKIQQVLAGLRADPRRAEGDWLQATFDASEVNLSRYLIRTSYPPKQLLQFRLDDVRYIMHLTRSDLTAMAVPLHEEKPTR